MKWNKIEFKYQEKLKKALNIHTLFLSAFVIHVSIVCYQLIISALVPNLRNGLLRPLLIEKL
jgi:hypothetical protein